MLQRYKAIFDSLSHGIFVIDRNLKITNTNKTAADLLGMSIDQMLETNFRSFQWRAVDGQGNSLKIENAPSMRALFKGDSVRDFHLGLESPRLGCRRWFSVDSDPIYENGSSAPSHAYVVFIDRTSQKLADEALRRSTMYLAAAQRVAAIGSLDIDLSTGLWTLTDEAYRIFSVCKESFEPSVETLASLVHQEDRQRFVSAFECVQTGKIPETMEYRVISVPGEERIIRQEIQVQTQKWHAPVLVATFQDISGLRQAERQKEELQADLFHAQRLDALGVLASGIAHDLNNTLVPILGLSEALTRALSHDDELRELAEAVHQAGERAHGLVKQILSFSRRTKSENKLLNVSTFIRETLRLVRAFIPSSIDIIERVDEVSPIFGDTGQLHQIIVNLCTNAAQAIGDNVGQIRISVSEVPADAIGRSLVRTPSYVCIAVSDTGCGIDDKVKQRIFEPFFTTKNVGEGVGLGLSIVHGIISAHGGEIRVHSRIGQGTCFEVYFPAAVGAIE